MNRHLIISGFLIFSAILSSEAQQQLKHDKKVFVSPEGKIYFNKATPVYFRISASPDENAPSYLLRSEKSPMYSNPMYFDTEGRNTLHSPSAVDTVTKKVVEPKRDVLFDVYADGKAPVTNIRMIHAKKFSVNKTTYYGQNLGVEFPAADEVSGVEASYISLNKASYQELSKSEQSFNEEKEYHIQYYSVDHVGNVESPKSIIFSMDLSAPKTTLSFLGNKKEKVLSSKALISLTSRDSLSGVNRIIYSINEGPEKIYTAPIPLSALQEGETKISYYAVDNVGNVENVKVIQTSTEKPGDKTDASTFSFYIDKEAPVVSFEIVGDQHNGKNLFISERSQFMIKASDEKSGVEKIIYSQNNPSPKQVYTVPFAVSGDGNQSISYAAADYVGNMTLAYIQKLFLDKASPKSVLSFTGKQFYNRDTLFITSDTKLTITSAESGSGIQKIVYTLDGKTGENYSAPLYVREDGFHTLGFNAVDNVNNAEDVKKRSFFVDNNPPKIIYNFSVKAIGEKTVRGETYAIYPSNTMLYIAATDNASGGEYIEYRINGKPAQTILPIKGFLPGNYEIEISARDVLKNKATQVIRFSIEN